MTDQPRPEGQQDVQRWLGRCMLRLQQYERLMKTLLAHHELAGPADTLEAQRAANLEKVSDKTLGTLVKSLFESYAVPDGFERELLPEDKVPTDRISMAISYRMTMAPERLAEVRAQIEELVVMRNELVHHFIERFDLWSDPGCEAALRHLEHCYQRIDHHHNELVGWPPWSRMTTRTPPSRWVRCLSCRETWPSGGWATRMGVSGRRSAPTWWS